MRVRTSFAILSVACCLVAQVPAAVAQDPVTVNPDVYKCTFENEHTRLCEVTLAPGAKIGMHSHPDHLVYALTAGTIRITKADGTAEEVAVTPGITLWLPAESHQGENIGGTEVKLIVVEFKEAHSSM